MVLKLSASGGLIEAFEVDVEAWRPTVLLGLNATLKSIVARSLGGEHAGWTPDLKSVGASYSVTCNGSEIDRSEWLFCLIPDSRIVLRAYLAGTDVIVSDAHEILRSIRESGRVEDPEVQRSLEDLEDLLDKLVDSLVLGFVKDYASLKRNADLFLQWKILAELSVVLAKLAEELKRYEEVNTESILPLQVDVLDSEAGRPASNWVIAYDRRLKERIPLRSLSSSVASSLLYNYIASFLAVPMKRYKLLVIEEPEEAMAPLQQVAFMRFLSRALEIAKSEQPKSETYVVLTTHSPYIALAVDADTYYLYYNKEKRKFIVKRGWPRRSFILADLMLLRGGIEG